MGVEYVQIRSLGGRSGPATIESSLLFGLVNSQGADIGFSVLQGEMGKKGGEFNRVFLHETFEQDLQASRCSQFFSSTRTACTYGAGKVGERLYGADPSHSREPQIVSSSLLYLQFSENLLPP